MHNDTKHSIVPKKRDAAPRITRIQSQQEHTPILAERRETRRLPSPVEF